MNCLAGLAEWRLPVSGVDAVRLAAHVGAEGLQIAFRDDIDASALQAEALDHGIRLLALAGNNFNDVGLTAESGIVRPLLERLLDTAVALGVPLVFVPSFRRSAIDGPEAFTRTAEVLRWAAGQAAERGLVLANENVLSGGRARALVAEVASPAFRLVLDTFNPVAAGLHVADLVVALSACLADQVHLKDGPPAVGPSPLLGSGSGRLDDTLAALREHRVPVHAVVLENDYRDGDLVRLATDLAWARRHARQFTTTEAGR